MEPSVTFLKNVHQDDGKLVFHKGKSYILLHEDEEHYFISINGNGNQCSQFPKTAEGEAFVVN